MSVDKMTVDEMSVDEMSADEMSVDGMSADESCIIKVYNSRGLTQTRNLPTISKPLRPA